MSENAARRRTPTPPEVAIRVLLAVLVVVAPLLMSAWFGLCPEYGNPNCPTSPQSAVAAYRSAPRALMQLFLLITLILPYVAPVGFLGLGVVAFARSPWLAAVGVVAGWVGSTVPWGIILDQATLYVAAARYADVASFVRIEDAYRHSPYLAAAAVGWGLHLVAYLVLGVALLRSDLVPRWTGIGLIAGTILMGPLAYGTGINALQVGGYLLVALASVPAAARLLAGKVHPRAGPD